MTYNEDSSDEIGNNHIGSSDQTPLRKNAFDLSDDEKIELKIRHSKIIKTFNSTRVEKKFNSSWELNLS